MFFYYLFVNAHALSNRLISIWHRRSSSKIYFSGTGRDDYYTLTSTSIPISEGANGMIASNNSSGISTPLSISVQQQTQLLQPNQQQQQQQQSPMPGQTQSNVPSVLYTVQRVITNERVITTSQIQSTEMLECTSSAATTYQTHSHQMMSQMTETQQNSNYFGGPSNSMPPTNVVSINRTLQGVSILCTHTHFTSCIFSNPFSPFSKFIR